MSLNELKLLRSRRKDYFKHSPDSYLALEANFAAVKLHRPKRLSQPDARPAFLDQRSRLELFVDRHPALLSLSRSQGNHLADDRVQVYRLQVNFNRPREI